MAQERTVQATIFEVFAGHQIGCALKVISGWLDRQRALLSLVARDLRRDGRRPTGRQGLPAETVLRGAGLKPQRQPGYDELAFMTSWPFTLRVQRLFAPLPGCRWPPKKSVLQRTIGALRPARWEAVKRALVAGAKPDKLDAAMVVRLDSTVTAALMHEPSDSALLADAVPVMSRRLRQAAKLPGAPAIRRHDRRMTAEAWPSAGPPTSNPAAAKTQGASSTES